MNIKPSKQKWLPLEYQGDVFVSGYEVEGPVEDERLMERMLERENVMSALRRVEANRGSAGVDGMPVSQLRNYLKEHWPCIREQLFTGQYIPSPVRRVELPKPGGGIRKLGIPTVLDRFIQQILLQVLQEDWDPSFSDASFGFRPGRSAHQAIARAQEYVKAVFKWVVDMDLEKFFDRVDHDVLMSEVKSIFKEMDSWIKRRLRCYLWKQWGRRGYRELRKRGVSRDLAWNTAKLAHGPWRLSRSPGLAFALPAKYFASLGVPRLFIKTT